ncbi:hypothetical protein L0N21_18450, partial [Fusicatenibacter saccharivorans]
NPACEYLNEEVSLELNLVMAYFTLQSKIIDSEVSSDEKAKYEKIMNEIRNVLDECEYCSEAYKGTLLEYCENHPS